MRSIAHRLSGPHRSLQATGHIRSRIHHLHPSFAIHVSSYLQHRKYDTTTSSDYEPVDEEDVEPTAIEDSHKNKVTAFGCLHLAASVASRSSKIDTFEQLLFESDVNNLKAAQTRLVDRKEHSHDFHLWVQLLQFRVRVSGLEGAWEIWRGLRKRSVDLPTDGRDAEILWNTFVKAAFKRKSLLEIFSYAQDLYQRTKRRHDLLYDYIVGLYLEAGPDRCYAWHCTLKQIDLPAPNSLERLIDVAVQSRTSLRSFRKIYENSENQRAYDGMITALCEQDNFDEAQEWHDFLISYKDFPTNASVAEPLRQRLAISGDTGKLKKIMPEVVESAASFSSTTPKTVEPRVKISREIMNRMLGEAHGVQSIKLSDSLCARLFATKYFSLDFCMRCAASLGVEKIGPLTLRELGVRCSDPQSVARELANLKGFGLGITNSTYSRVIVQSACESRREILRSVLETDQHPDLFDDRNIQKRLLANYIHAKDWVQVQRTLFILSSASDETLSEAWNALLQAHIESKDPEKIQQTIDDMLNHRIVFAKKTVSLSFTTLASSTDSEKQADLLWVWLRKMRFVTSLWLRVLRSGGDVPLTAWHGVIKYYGERGRISDLHRLCSWLLKLYPKRRQSAILSPDGNKLASRQESSQLAANSSQEIAAASPLNQIFPPNRVKSIMLWSLLKTNRPRNLPSLESMEPLVLLNGREAPAHEAGDQSKTLDVPENPTISGEGWACGLSLLQELRQQGVAVQTEDVRSSCRQILRILFGPRHRSWQELKSRRSNRYSMEQVIQHMNEIWGTPTLLAVPRTLQEGNDKQVAASSLQKYMLEDRRKPARKIRLVWADDARDRDDSGRR